MLMGVPKATSNKQQQAQPTHTACHTNIDYVEKLMNIQMVSVNYMFACVLSKSGGKRTRHSKANARNGVDAQTRTATARARQQTRTQTNNMTTQKDRLQ